MTRLTFGVTSSPFLATQVLRQVASDHEDEFPQEAAIVRQSFHVDDCLMGADNLEGAIAKKKGLNHSGGSRGGSMGSMEPPYLREYRIAKSFAH